MRYHYEKPDSEILILSLEATILSQTDGDGKGKGNRNEPIVIEPTDPGLRTMEANW